jgi:phosphopantothenoylcysteine decarboxylase/phosphopantothenate--cysteine ligase
MRILVTAGPTREPIDTVRFISNASSGRMGFAVAAEAAARGHEAILLTGPVALETPSGVQRRDFVAVCDLQRLLAEEFSSCDALAMSAAVGDFTVECPGGAKLSRRDGAVDISLVPTPDLIAGVAADKKPTQVVCAFAVEDLPHDEAIAKARDEMEQKHADMVVLNTPEAMAAEASWACILSDDAVLLEAADRCKTELAAAIVDCLETIYQRKCANRKEGS